MKFPYAQYEYPQGIVQRPTLPVTFTYGKVSIPYADALVDTGADQTMLPLEFATSFGFSFDLKRDGEEWNGAGGGKFIVYHSPKPIQFSIEQNGFQKIEWEGHVCFTLKQPTILLGHRGCLENLDLIFRGRQKVLEVNKTS